MTALWQPTAETLSLWPHQEEGKEALRDRIRHGLKRIMVCAPTGSGKGEMMVDLAQEAYQRDNPAALFADRIVLVDQIDERLTRYGVPHGVAQAENTFGRQELIQACSIQTVEKREYFNSLRLAVWDEAHVKRKRLMEFLRNWGGPVIGFSATPITPGLADFYEDVINVATTDELVEQGWLAPLKVYAAIESDMAGAAMTGGEWTSSAVRERGRVIYGNIVDEWEKLTFKEFGGPVKTLLFSADIPHGEELCKEFQERGYDFRQTTHHDDASTTRRMIEQFRRGEFVGLTSVEKCVKGFDVPDVLCIIGARPYRKSLAALLQQLGRGMRISHGKEFCMYIDATGNFAGWYDDISEFWAKGVSKLKAPDKDKIRKEGNKRTDSTCHQCGFIRPPGSKGVCPYCGAEARRRKTTVAQQTGTMAELTRPGSRDWQQNKSWTWKNLCRAALDRKGGDEYMANRMALAVYREMYGEWPASKFNPVEGYADQRVENKLRSSIIKYAKRRSK